MLTDKINTKKGHDKTTVLKQFHPLVLSKVLTPVWFWWPLRLSFKSNSELSSHYRIRSSTRNVAQNRKSSYKVKVGISRPLQCFLCWHNSYLQTSAIQDSFKHHLQILKYIYSKTYLLDVRMQLRLSLNLTRSHTHKHFLNTSKSNGTHWQKSQRQCNTKLHFQCNLSASPCKTSRVTSWILQLWKREPPTRASRWVIPVHLRLT